MTGVQTCALPISSNDLKRSLVKKRQKKLKIYSFYPIDRADCSCQKIILDWQKQIIKLSPKQRKLAIQQQKYLTCPSIKKRLKHYKITCKNCGAILGYCWASDKSLQDWVDFHYTNWTDGDRKSTRLNSSHIPLSRMPSSA